LNNMKTTQREECQGTTFRWISLSAGPHLSASRGLARSARLRDKEARGAEGKLETMTDNRGREQARPRDADSGLQARINYVDSVFYYRLQIYAEVGSNPDLTPRIN